ncbi:MAG: MarR family transcriptional regulator [Lachnospiraceae bacterium]|nr:MarR family transcriptional regulator [Lachnospiraceae bacterium]
MDNNLREQFIALMTQCRKINASFSSGCEMQMNEMAILHIISGKCSCCPCEDSGVNLDVQSIQERLQISRPAVSYILNTLEKKSYIVREIDPKDRRRIVIHITPAGNCAAELSMRQHDDAWDRLITEFGQEDMMELISLMNRLFTIMGQF